MLSSRMIVVWMKCFTLNVAKLSAMKPFSVCFPFCLVGFCRFPMGVGMVHYCVEGQAELP